MAVDFLPPLSSAHKKTRTRRAFGRYGSKTQWALTRYSRVRRCRLYGSRRDNKTFNRLHCHKRATAVDVLALVVTLFGVFS